MGIGWTWELCRQAFYTNLAPGDYVFHVEASTNGRVWTDSSAEWRFRRQPTFFQTRIFYIGSVMLLCLAGVGVWKLRIRMMRREFAAVLAERLRLGRELHDTLLQNLVGLALQFDVLADGLGSLTADGRRRLVRVRKQVEGYVREARQSVCRLRSPLPPSSPDLATSLVEFGAQAADGNTTFESHVEGQPLDYSPKLRRAIIRIGRKPSQRRAARRRTADQVDIRFEPCAVDLCVVDDGCGFEVDQARSVADDHYGLISMRERAADIGAQLEIVSVRGRGTDRPPQSTAPRRLIASCHTSKSRQSSRTKPPEAFAFSALTTIGYRREGIALIIDREPDMTVVAMAASGPEAVALFKRHLPDVTLMDLQLGRMSGLETIRLIRQYQEAANIVVLTMYRRR